MFLFPLHLTHKNGFSEQFDVPQILGAFIIIFFNLSPSPETQEIAFFWKNKMNETESLRVSLDGSDTQVQGAKHLRGWPVPLQHRSQSPQNTSDSTVVKQAPQRVTVHPTCSSPLYVHIEKPAPCALEFRNPHPQLQKSLHTSVATWLWPPISKYSHYFLFEKIVCGHVAGGGGSGACACGIPQEASTLPFGT